MRLRPLSLRLSVFLLSVHLCLVASWLLNGGISHRLMIADTISFTLFSVFHCTYLLGRGSTCAFFLISAAVSWSFEQAGVATGVVCGRYYYTDRLGPKIGHVPAIIPLAWFMMIYPSYVLAELILLDRRIPADRSAEQPLGWSRIVMRSALGGIIMTGWDMTMDPKMVRSGHWVWVDGGPYFGVPMQNFVGWFATTFKVYFLFGAWERLRGNKRRSYSCLSGRGVSDGFAILPPLLAFAGIALRNMLYPGIGQNQSPDDQALCLIAVYSMGFPLLVGFIRWFHLQEQESGKLGSSSAKQS